MISIATYADLRGTNYSGIAESSSAKAIHYLNGKIHNENGPAIIWRDNSKSFYFMDEYYGDNNKFNKKTWMKFLLFQIFN